VPGDPTPERDSALRWEVNALRELGWAALLALIAAGGAVRGFWWLAKVFAVGAVLAFVVSAREYLYASLKRQRLKKAARHQSVA